MDGFKRLLDGYAKFRATTYPENQALYRELADRGQSPHTMVIACCDSRVDPTIIFGAAPGTLFVVRNVANLVPPYEPHGDYHGTSAALEFAVIGLGVTSIVVLGHAHCGGVQAFLEGSYDGASSGLFIAKWMSIMKAAHGLALSLRADEDPGTAQRALEQAAVAISLENLQSFPFVSEGLQAGRLSLHGTYFDIGAGTLYAYQEHDKSFHPLGQPDAG